MDKKETAKLLMTIKTSYKRFFDGGKEEFIQMVEIWQEMLEDEPYEMAKQALVDFSRVSPFPPTIADIYRPYKDMLAKREVDKRESINIYYRAIANYPCYKDTADAQKEFMRILGNPDPEKAEKFERDLIKFVREREMSEEYIPPLIEYMKGVKAIE